MKLARRTTAIVLIAGCLSLGGCATIAQNLIGELAAESSCRGGDTGNDGGPYYDSACLDDIGRWQDENPM